MKKLIIFAFCFLAICSCVDRHSSSHRSWMKLGNMADSLTEALDQSFIIGFSRVEVDDMIKKLDEIEDTSHAVTARKLYWKGWILARDSGSACGARTLERALALVDSSDAPYDYLRIRSLLYGECHPSTIVKYSTLLNSALDYSKIGDTLMLCRTYNQLGRILWSIGEHEQCMSYVEKALQLANEAQYEMLELSLLNNKSILLSMMNKNDEAERIMMNLENSDKRWKNKDLNYDFYSNAAYILQKPEYLDSAKSLFSRTTEADKVYSIEYLQTLYFSDNEKYVDSIYAILWNGINAITDNDLKKHIYLMHYSREKEQGHPAEALSALEMYEKAQKELEDSLNSMEVINLDKRHEIAMYNMLNASKATELRLKILIGILCLLFAFGIGAFFIARYIKNMKQQQRQAETEITQNRLGLTASKLTIEEKDKVIDEISRHIHTLEEKGDVKQNDAQQISNVIQIHRSGHDENENFIEMFTKIHPDFATEMSRRYPGITEANVKMGMYILMGLNSKQISRLLMITPEGVKKRRYRLRTIMKLETGESLENALQELADSLR